jgi:hypothetical protein
MKKHTHFKVTGKEVWLAVALAVMGFVFSTREYLLFLDSLSPFEGLIIYYVVLYISLYALSKLGLVIFGFKVQSLVQTAGLLMVTFSFFLVVDWTSGWVGIVTGKPNISNVFLQDEDGAVWWLWSQVISNAELCRFATFVFTPFALALSGGLLVSKKVKLGF